MTRRRHLPHHSVGYPWFNDDGFAIVVERWSDVEGVEDHRDVCEQGGLCEMPSRTNPTGRTLEGVSHQSPSKLSVTFFRIQKQSA